MRLSGEMYNEMHQPPGHKGQNEKEKRLFPVASTRWLYAAWSILISVLSCAG
jgi:hypothetical protein